MDRAGDWSENNSISFILETTGDSVDVNKLNDFEMSPLWTLLCRSYRRKALVDSDRTELNSYEKDNTIGVENRRHRNDNQTHPVEKDLDGFLSLFLKTFKKRVNLELCHPQTGETPLLHVMYIYFQSRRWDALINHHQQTGKYYYIQNMLDHTSHQSNGEYATHFVTSPGLESALYPYWDEYQAVKVFQTLLHHGADPNNAGKSPYGKPPLHLAVTVACLNSDENRTFFFNIIILLTKERHGCKVIDYNKKDRFGNTALHLACSLGDDFYVNEHKCYQFVRYFDEQYYEPLITLLAKHTDIELKNDDGHTPLHLICKSRNSRGLRELLAFKPDIHAKDNNNLNPLQLLLHQQTSECVFDHNWKRMDEEQERGTLASDTGPVRKKAKHPSHADLIGEREITRLTMIYELFNYSFYTSDNYMEFYNPKYNVNKIAF